MTKRRKNTPALATDPLEALKRDNLVNYKPAMGSAEALKAEPVIAVNIPDAGRVVKTYRRADMLDAALQKSIITEAQHTVGKRFKYLYEVANTVPYAQQNLDGVKSEGSADNSIDLIMARRAEAIGEFNQMVLWLGGAGSFLTWSLRGVLLRGYSFNDMIREHGQSFHFWRANFLSALQVLETHVKKSSKSSQKAVANL